MGGFCVEIFRNRSCTIVVEVIVLPFKSKFYFRVNNEHMASSLSKVIKKAWTSVRVHKVWTVIILVAVFYVGYWGVGKIRGTTSETRFVLATAERKTITVSVSGTGQVTATSQLDLKPKVSGDVVWVGAKAGTKVSSGAGLLTIDDTDARKTLSDAELDLEETKLGLDKWVAQAP